MPFLPSGHIRRHGTPGGSTHRRWLYACFSSNITTLLNGTDLSGSEKWRIRLEQYSSKWELLQHFQQLHLVLLLPDRYEWSEAWNEKPLTQHTMATHRVTSNSLGCVENDREGIPTDFRRRKDWLNQSNKLIRREKTPTNKSKQWTG